jgi:hypothetical protein
MRWVFAVMALLLALPASARNLQEPALPQMDLARAWLELLDAGQFQQAWADATDNLQRDSDLARWTQSVHRARRSNAAVRCRKGLAFELLEEPPRVVALFVTEFADGHRISEKVTLPADATRATQISAYRAGPPAPEGSASCDTQPAQPRRSTP